MAKTHGKDSHLSVDGAAVGDYCDSIELDRSVDMADSTTIGQESKTFLPGLDGAAMTLAGKWDSIAEVGPDAVLAPALASKELVAFAYGPEGNAAGKIRYTGNCYVERYAVSSPLEGIVKFNSTLRVNGAVARDVFA
jgi:hypothetical protein